MRRRLLFTGVLAVLAVVGGALAPAANALDPVSADAAVCAGAGSLGYNVPGPQGSCQQVIPAGPSGPARCTTDQLSVFVHFQVNGAGTGVPFSLKVGRPDGSSEVVSPPPPPGQWGTVQVPITNTGAVGPWTVKVHADATATTDPYDATGTFAVQVCQPAGYSLGVNPAATTINPGGSFTATLNVNPSGGFNGPVALSAGNVPPGVTVSFNPSSVPAPGSSQVTITASPAAAAQTTTINLNGSSSAGPRSTPFALTVGQPAPPQSPPPAFSQVVASSFPAQPFITCLQGQFNAPQVGPSSAQLWYVKPSASGPLDVSVIASAVNAAETGSITGTLFQGATNLGSVTATMPATGETTVVLPVAVTAGTLYRLAIVRGAATAPGTPEAHHYRLGFAGVQVTVGLSSPTWQSFEHEHQYLHVNAVAGEHVTLGFLNSTNPIDPTSGEVEVVAPGGAPVAGSSGPLPLTAGFTAPVTGTYTVIAHMEGHWTMTNAGGADTGIYMDTCPPPDHDEDGVPDKVDNCPTVPNEAQADRDGDGIGDACDNDNDNDGIVDEVDNCVAIPNAGQEDRDGDHIGDVCDPDNDNDGVVDGDDDCPLVANGDQRDTDHDGRGDACDASYALGRMTGGGSVFTAGGARVTHGFTVYCTPSAGSNNLQVNWGKGLAFHLESISAAYCGLDHGLDGGHPAAGFNVYLGKGTGRLNDGRTATVEWLFTDAGEPGKNDTAIIRIKDAQGNVLVEVSGNLDKGNHQAHG